jgi:hypothetical protein
VTSANSPVAGVGIEQRGRLLQNLFERRRVARFGGGEHRLQPVGDIALALLLEFHGLAVDRGGQIDIRVELHQPVDLRGIGTDRRDMLDGFRLVGLLQVEQQLVAMSQVVPHPVGHVGEQH